MRRRTYALIPVALALAGAVPASAQQPGQEGEVELVFEREIFTYPAYERANPFAPLVGDASGPRFEDLRLLGIIHSPDPDRSVVLFGAGGGGNQQSGRTFRVRRGDVLGNTRIVEVQPTRVIVEVEEFGVTEQHVMELRKRVEGASS